MTEAAESLRLPSWSGLGWRSFIVLVGDEECSPSSTVSSLGANPLAPRGILLLEAAGGRPGEELLLLLSTVNTTSRPGFDGSESESDCLGELIELLLEDAAGGCGDLMLGEARGGLGW